MAEMPEHGIAQRSGLVLHTSFRCPACTSLPMVESGFISCPDGHEYTAIGLALATNRNTVSALWAAIRALEDDAAGLDYLVAQYPTERVEARRREAAAARDAAQSLRQHTEAAQRRLAALVEDEMP